VKFIILVSKKPTIKEIASFTMVYKIIVTTICIQGNKKYVFCKKQYFYYLKNYQFTYTIRVKYLI
jgi:uncharacterized membrane protein